MPVEEFAYLLLRVVPRIDRGERINAGVVLFSRRHGFIGARVALDPARLRALEPAAECEEVQRHLAALAAVAEGRTEGGRVAGLEPSERFHWLAAPSSTVIQPSEVHTGLTEDPQATLERLFRELVL